MKIAAYQTLVPPAGSMLALDWIRDRITYCERESIEILCCPETVLGGLADHHPDPHSFAISLDDLADRLAPLTSQSVTTIIGFTEDGGAGVLYNSVAVQMPGKPAALYRKRHPAIRKSIYTAGTHSPVFDLDGLRFGIMICNDSNFPELAAELAGQGARVIFVPTNNTLRPEGADVVDWARSVDITRAKDNGVIIMRADVSGHGDGRLSYGSSAIVDASGTVLATGRRLMEDFLVTELTV